MKNYYEEYQKKLVSAEEAAKVVKSGDWLDYGWITGIPDAVDRALAKRTDELFDVKVRGAIALKTPAIFEREDAKEHFTWVSWHTSGVERKMVKAGMGYYAPIRFSELPRYYRDGLCVDVAILQVAPMDEKGYFNLGPNVPSIAAMLGQAKKIIFEVNANVPYAYGGFENSWHIDDVDMVVEGENAQMGEMLSKPASPEEEKIAELVVAQIPNGACLQLGIGGLPNAVGSAIVESDIKDLGVHTEMYVDAFVKMSKAGKINGSKKNIDKGRQVYAIAGGSKELWDFIDHNPACMAAPVDYTNDIARVSSIDNFISINGAVDVDLFGQISAESTGIQHISGAGGQMDFVIGAYLSKGGKSFICCTSAYTDKKGEKHSRIRPTLLEGTVVTSTRSNANYIVTEYGIVNLKGLSTWERAEALISIAHPDFRDELIKEAEKLHIWRK